MAFNNSRSPPKAGQFFRLSPGGLWTSQELNPLWSHDTPEYFQDKNSLTEVQPVVNERYSGGLNIRVEVDDEGRRRQAERIKKLIVHDHTYYKRDIFSKRKSKGINDLVMRALAGVQDEPKPNKGEVSESTKKTQLYKYLTTPIDDRRSTGEAFGHSMVREIIKARPPHISMRTGRAARAPVSNPEESQQQNVPMPSHVSPSATTVMFPWGSSLMPPPAVSIPPLVYHSVHPPSFVHQDAKYWTREQCSEYEQWWQQLPSCQYSCCAHSNMAGQSIL